MPGTRVEDVTGAGNAFCGGFLASLAATRAAHRTPNATSNSPSPSSSSTSASTNNGGGQHSMPMFPPQAHGGSDQVGGVAGERASVSLTGGVSISGVTYSREELCEACVWGNVSSSFMIEERGVPHTHLGQLRQAAVERAATVRKRAKWAVPVRAQAQGGVGYGGNGASRGLGGARGVAACAGAAGGRFVAGRGQGGAVGTAAGVWVRQLGVGAGGSMSKGAPSRVSRRVMTARPAAVKAVLASHKRVTGPCCGRLVR